MDCTGRPPIRHGSRLMRQAAQPDRNLPADLRDTFECEIDQVALQGTLLTARQAQCT